MTLTFKYAYSLHIQNNGVGVALNNSTLIYLQNFFLKLYQLIKTFILNYTINVRMPKHTENETTELHNCYKYNIHLSKIQNN